MQLLLKNDNETIALGRKIAKACSEASVVYLMGELGAGKTTLTRGIVTAFGHQGMVKSPTYTLVEPYQFENWQLNHFDLYRLGDPEELEFIGIRDYFHESSINLIEWPSKGMGILPEADLIVHLSYYETQRMAELKANSAVGERLLLKLEQE